MLSKTKACMIAVALVFASAAALVARPASDVDSVKAVNEAFDAALSRRDIAALDTAWAQEPSVSAIHPSSKGVIIGWEAVRKSWEGAFQAFPELSVAMKEPKVQVLGSVAWVVGVEAVRGRRANGEVVEFSALTTNVYQKRGDRWLMVHHQASRAPQ